MPEWIHTHIFLYICENMQIDENDILTEKQKVTAYVIIFVTLNSFSLIIASFE